MSPYIAALPMYDWPERRDEVDAEWATLRDRLRADGIDAPKSLVRRNGDMPAVPGGIVDLHGEMIAPDPATLPPDELDLPTLWRHPQLLFSQTCWGPMVQEQLFLQATPLDQPDYSDFSGGAGTRYSSAIVMRREPGGAGDVPPPSDGGAWLPLEKIQGRRLAYNEAHSWSGVLGLQRAFRAAGREPLALGDHLATGGHRLSIRAVAEGRADFAAIDCRTWDLARRYEPAAAELVVVGWTRLAMGLPYIASSALGSLHPRIRGALNPPRDPAGLRKRLLASGIAHEDEIVGASEAQIAAIEAHAGPLPGSYRSILALLGNGAGRLISDDAAFYVSQLAALNDRSRDLYRASAQAGVDRQPLPHNAFFISGRAGGHQSFVLADGSEDCAVRAYAEDTKRIETVHDSVWDWIMEIVRDSEVDRANGG